MIRLIPQGVPAAASTTYTFEIIEKLCKKYCINDSINPVVSPVFSISNQELVGTTLYATVQCIISVNYRPKGSCNTCGMITNTFVETFTVSFASATSESTASVSSVNGYSDPAYICSQNCNAAQGIKDVGSVTVSMS